uniref:At4g15545-like C-terminal domain-containing protein n=1 Tax=Leersia perrieri TaxID=77586 RepID=A0A0D9WGD3_9ORYZ
MMEGEIEEEVAAPTVAPAAAEFGLPAEVMAVLPEDPFEQLDVARKITSIALASRLGRLEAEAARLRAELAERDAAAEDLRERVEQLDAALAVATGRLRRAEEDKEALLRDNSLLSNTVRKLNRDVAKLEVFKKTLMQSLQEDEDPANTAPRARANEASNFSSTPFVGASKSSQLSETASSVSEESSHVDPEVPRPPRPHVFLPSYNNTPRVTPPDSPPRSFASISPPRRHSISVTSRNIFDDRSSVYSGHHSSMTSPFDAASHTGRTRVDGKEFFRQVRNRLSYEQFSAFLANVKELNSHKQTREPVTNNTHTVSLHRVSSFVNLVTRHPRSLRTSTPP